MPGRKAYAHAVKVLLSCKHIVLFFPVPVEGDLVLCRRCDKYRMFRKVCEWRIKCKDCHLHRWVGTGERTGYDLARKHAERYTHTVEIWQTDTLQDTITKPVSLPSCDIPSSHDPVSSP